MYRLLIAEYTVVELSDMRLLNGETRSNSWKARRPYTEIFPGRRLPNHVKFQILVTVFVKQGSLQHLEGELVDPAMCELYSLRKLCYTELRITAAPARAIANELNTSNASVWGVMLEMYLHPFKFQKIQDLSADDFPRCMDFRQWYLLQIVNMLHFQTCLYFTDEASFTRERIESQ
jgi:hypothetical protein